MGLVSELRRRNVFRVAIAYVLIAWIVLEAGDVLAPALHLPEWVVSALVFFLVLGFPLALIFAWAFELTPEGIKLEKHVDRSKSITHIMGRKLDYVIIGVLAVAVVLFAFDEWVLEPAHDDQPVQVITEVAIDQEAEIADNSIAVLAFANMSSDENNEYFADGLSEEILNRLTELRDLRVTGRTSSFSFKGRSEDLRTIGDLLGVAHILDGSVRRQADQVRVTAQLVRARDGFHLWSETFEVQLNDVFAVQDEIAESVAGALDVLLNEETRKLMQDAGIRNVDAFVAYQRGVELFIRAHEVEGVERMDLLVEANRYFDEAIEHAADFAAAHFMKSDYFVHLSFMQDTSLEQQRIAVELLRAALEKASRHTRDRKRRAIIEINLALFSEDWTLIRPYLEEVAQLPGCRSPNWIGALGAFIPTLIEEITAEWRACEPLNASTYFTSSRSMMYSGKGEEALATFDLAISKLGPQLFFGAHRTRLLIAMGSIDEARTEAESIKYRSSRTDALGILILAAEGKLELAKQSAELWYADYPEWLRHESSENMAIQVAAATGQRQLANELASQLDGLPTGVMSLISTVNNCFCGAPFDIEATPNFQARLQEAGFFWPPPSPIKYPAKHW